MTRKFTLTLFCVGLGLLKMFSQTVENFWQNESGNCLSLTGTSSSYMASSGISGDYRDTAFTIEAWIYNNGGSYNVLTIGSAGASGGIELNIDDSYGPFVEISNSSSNIEVKKTNRARQLFTDRWNHVAVTWSNHDTTVCIYINGMLYHKKYVNQMEISFPSDAKIYVGSNLGSSDWMNAKIDELRIWNKALTQSQINANMHSTSTGTESNLIGLYHFDNTDLTATDNSASGNTLTANNLTSSNFETSGAHIPDKNVGYRKLIQNTTWQESDTIEDGITWRFKEYDDLFERVQNLSVLEVDPSVADVEFKLVVLPDGATYQKTSEIAKQYGAIAAVNGTYWNTSSMISASDFPSNEITQWGAGVYTRVDGEDITPTYLIQSLPNSLFGEPENQDCDYADDCAFAFDNFESNYSIVKRPKKLEFNESDSSYVHGWTGYTDHANALSSGPLLVYDDTVAYEYRNSYRQWNSGEKPWEWQVGDQPFINIGVKDDGTVVMVTGDGRRTQSVGCGAPQMAQVMKALGCKEALRLDGGGSTTMYIRGKGVVNYPSDNSTYDHAGERADNSFILVMPKNKKGSGLGAKFKHGTTYASIANDEIGNPDGSFTIDLWARNDTSFNAYSSGQQDLISKQGRISSVQAGYFIEWDNANKYLKAGIAGGSSWNTMYATFDIDSCQWFNIALSYNATTTKSYLIINGIAMDSATVSSPYYNDQVDLHIGNSQYYSSNKAYFTIDEFRYWNRYVSAEEFKTLKYKKFEGSNEDLTVEVSFDELNSDGTFTNYGDENITVNAEGGFSTNDLVLEYAPIGDTIISKYDSIIGVYPGKDTVYSSNIALASDFSYDTYVLASVLTDESIETEENAADKTGNNKYYIYSPHAAAVTVRIPLSSTGLTLESSDVISFLYSNNNTTFEATSIDGTIDNDTIVFEDAELETGYYAIGVSEISFTEGAGQSLILGGSQGITIENDDIDDVLSNNFTLEAWARYSGSAPTSNVPIFSSNGRINSLSTGMTIEFLSDGSGKIEVAWGINASGWTKLYGETSWGSDEWHHVALVCENDSIRLYEDGTRVDAANTNGYYENTYKLGIGYSYNYGKYLTGNLDEVRIWKKALSQDEIKASMFTDLTGNEDSLAVYYNFNNDSVGYALCLGGDAINGEFVTTETTLTETSTAVIGILDDNYYSNISAAWSGVSESSDESGLQLSTETVSTEQNAVFGTNALTGSSSKLLNRIWNVDVNDSTATYNLTFDLSKSLEEVPSYMQYFLLSGSDINNLSTKDTTENVTDGVVTFSSVALKDGFYTLGWSSTVRDSIEDYLCEGSSYVFGNETLTESGVYSQTFETADGNDSIVVLTLISSSSITVNLEETICSGESYTIGNQSFSETGNFSVTLTTVHGCDSIINLSLTINELDLGITQDGLTLIANTSGASYQWINCNDSSIINGATDRSYTGTEGSSYAVIIDDGYCNDTSDCVTATATPSTNINGNSATQINVYPNPAKNKLSITSDASISEIKLFSITGKLIHQYSVNGSSISLDITDLDKGYYVLNIKSDNSIITKSFIKK